MSASVRVIKDTGGAGVRALAARLMAAARGRVLVGVPSGKEEADGMSIAHLGAIHEFGGFVKPHTRESQVLRFQAGRYNDDSLTGIDRFRFAKKSAKSAILIRAKAAVYSKGITIPARPWLRPGIRNNLNRTSRLAKRALAQVAEGTLTGAQALETIGADAAGAVKRYFVTGDFAPNARSTIRKKGSSRPLIDTAALRQSVTHVVEGA